MICNKCKSRIEPGNSACENCGEKVSNMPQGSENQNEPVFDAKKFSVGINWDVNTFNSANQKKVEEVSFDWGSMDVFTELKQKEEPKVEEEPQVLENIAEPATEVKETVSPIIEAAPTISEDPITPKEDLNETKYKEVELYSEPMQSKPMEKNFVTEEESEIASKIPDWAIPKGGLKQEDIENYQKIENVQINEATLDEEINSAPRSEEVKPKFTLDDLFAEGAKETVTPEPTVPVFTPENVFASVEEPVVEVAVTAQAEKPVVDVVQEAEITAPVEEPTVPVFTPENVFAPVEEPVVEVAVTAQAEKPVVDVVQEVEVATPVEEPTVPVYTPENVFSSTENTVEIPATVSVEEPVIEESVKTDSEETYTEPLVGEEKGETTFTLDDLFGDEEKEEVFEVEKNNFTPESVFAVKEEVVEKSVFTPDQIFSPDTPKVDAVQIAEPTPEVETAPIEEPTPVVGVAPIVEPTPEVEAAPIVEPTPEVEVAPIVEPTPEVEVAPIVEPTPEVEPTPIVEPTPEVEPTPIVEPTPEVEAAPSTPIVEPTTNVEPELVTEDNKTFKMPEVEVKLDAAQEIDDSEKDTIIEGKELEDLLFREVTRDQAQKTQKVNKFYTFNRKNEEFQRLLDEEYEKYQQEKNESKGGFSNYAAERKFETSEEFEGILSAEHIEEMTKAREMFFEEETIDAKSELKDDAAPIKARPEPKVDANEIKEVATINKVMVDSPAKSEALEEPIKKEAIPELSKAEKKALDKKQKEEAKLARKAAKDEEDDDYDDEKGGLAGKIIIGVLFALIICMVVILVVKFVAPTSEMAEFIDSFALKILNLFQ